MLKSFFLALVLLSLVAALNFPLSSNIEPDGSSSDWDHFQIPPAFTSGAAFNQVNLASAGLIPFNYDQASWTFCDTSASTVPGFASTANLYTNTLTLSGSATLSSTSLLYSCFDIFGTLSAPQVIPGVIKSAAGSFGFTALLLEATTGHIQIQTLSSQSGTLTWTSTVPTASFTSTPLTSGSAYVAPVFSGVLSSVAFAPAAAFSGSGITFLRGQFGVGATSSAQTVFQLPSGAAPAADSSFVVICADDAVATVTVTATGLVTYSGAAQDWCSLDGISFITSSISPVTGQSSSGFNAYYSSLYRDATDATLGRPSLAVTKYWGLQFTGTAAYGTGAQIASFESLQYQLTPGFETKYFPVVTSQGVQVLQNDITTYASTFSLTGSSSLSAIPSNFLRVFAANTPSTSSFALLIESGNLASLATINFSFSTGVQATYSIPQSSWLGAVQFSRFHSGASGNVFELIFSDAVQTAAGNSVEVSVGSAAFIYTF
jgi:hypothetical protein